jgi:hypothetical protein
MSNIWNGSNNNWAANLNVQRSFGGYRSEAGATLAKAKEAVSDGKLDMAELYELVTGLGTRFGETRALDQPEASGREAVSYINAEGQEALRKILTHCAKVDAFDPADSRVKEAAKILSQSFGMTIPGLSSEEDLWK